MSASRNHPMTAVGARMAEIPASIRALAMLSTVQGGCGHDLV